MPKRHPVVRAALCALILLSAGSAEAGEVELVSRRHPSFVAPQAPGNSGQPALSADGRWMAFTSTSPNLVPGQSDANVWSDVFLLDRDSGTLSLVSHAAGFPSTTGSSFSADPSISADGRYIVFLSRSNNLIPGQTGSTSLWQVFLYDRIAGTTTLVSHADGSSTAGANNSSVEATVSKDGGYVVFSSAATDLVPGQSDTNGTSDIFLYDRAASTLTLVSHASSGGAAAASGVAPTISEDGRHVLYASSATDLIAGLSDTNNLPDIFLYDRVSGTTTLASHAAGLPGQTGNAHSQPLGLSDDGAYAVFRSMATDLVAGQADAAGTLDVFLFERATGNVTLLSHADGAPASAVGAESAQISSDGAWIALWSLAGNLVPGQTDTNGAADVFLIARATGATTLVSRQSGTAATAANGSSDGARLSEDGQYLLFVSSATDLLAGQSDANGERDVFLFDRVAGTTVLASHAQGSSLTAGNGTSWEGALSANGAFAAYSSTATDLTGETDAYDRGDVFVFSRSGGTNEAVSLSDPVTRLTPDGDSFAAVSRSGRFVMLTGYGKDVVEGQIEANSYSDVFLLDRLLGTATLVSHADGSPTTTADQPSFGRGISQDGKWVVFDSDASDLIPDIGPPPPFGVRYNVFLYGRDNDSLTLVSRSAADPTKRANGSSDRGALSGDGRYVAFVSRATDLVDGQIDFANGPLGSEDVFLYDRVTGGMTLVSRAASNPLQAVEGAFNNQLVGISLDGRWVAFSSRANDLLAGQVDGNGVNDLFLFDRLSGAVTLVTRAAGTATTTANAETRLLKPPALSADGRYFAFLSPATNLVAGQVDSNGVEDLFVFDRVTGVVTLVTRKSGTTATTGNGEAYWPRISEDGRTLVFSSRATDLVPGQVDLNQGYDAFLYELGTGTLSLLTPDGTSTHPTAMSFTQAVSARGRFVAVGSMDTLRVPGQVDQNGPGEDLFILDRLTGSARLASRALASPLTTGNNVSFGGSFAADGGLFFFNSQATDLVPGDYNGKLDVFVHSSGSTSAADFYTLTPCRVVDTRGGSALASGQAVLFALHGQCGIPATAKAVAVNVTALQSSGNGNVTLYPGNVEQPSASTLNFPAGTVRAGNALLPLAFDGTGTLAATPFVAGGGTVHLLLDVSGWFE